MKKWCRRISGLLAGIGTITWIVGLAEYTKNTTSGTRGDIYWDYSDVLVLVGFAMFAVFWTTYCILEGDSILEKGKEE